MVSLTESKKTIIDAGVQDMSRPKERPPKTNWKIEILKKGVYVIQHISPEAASNLVWKQFTRPGRSKFTPNQRVLVDKAEIGMMSYFGHEIVTYRWGNGKKKILLSHGWNSKAADFRRLIESLVEKGFTVEGIDMKAHGKSEGARTSLPEMRDILKNYYVKNGPFYGVIGYSIGGMCAGITLSELSKNLHPEKLFIIAAPSHTRYFFRDTIEGLGYNEKVYLAMCNLVQKNYFESIDYFDLRKKQHLIHGIEMYLIYDENDKTVPLERGKELYNAYPQAHFVHTRGLGHYKVITYEKVIQYISDQLES